MKSQLLAGKAYDDISLRLRATGVDPREPLAHKRKWLRTCQEKNSVPGYNTMTKVVRGSRLAALHRAPPMLHLTASTTANNSVAKLSIQTTTWLFQMAELRVSRSEVLYLCWNVFSFQTR